MISDENLLPANETWHAPIQNAVYFGMDWNCPAYHIRLHEMLTEYHGSITAENTMKFILPGLNSGNLQAVIYDLTREWVYFSYGYQYEDDKGKRVRIDAYMRPYIGINLKEAFAWKNE